MASSSAYIKGRKTPENRACQACSLMKPSLEHLRQSAQRDRCPFCCMALEAFLQYRPDLEEVDIDHITFWSGPRAWDKPIFAKLALKDSEHHLELYTLVDQPLPWNNFTVGTNISGDTGSDQALSWVLNCLNTCLKSHISCGSQGQSHLPARVLDLGTLSPVSFREQIVLYETRNEVASYACLSYCWGSGQHLQTTKSNIAEFKQSITWNCLPASFQDAIIFTLKLQIRYLWIDSLCIIQDDEEDKQREINQMCSIYENSTITLAVVKSEDPHGGCFTAVGPEYRGYLLKEKQLGKERWKVYAREKLPHNKFRNYHIVQSHHLPLIQRAWAFQERMLSPRVVHFGPQELLWECREVSACECGDAKFAEGSKKLQHSIYLSNKSTPRDLSWWFKTVEDYTVLHLSYLEDRLSALDGLAAQFKTHRADNYILGLWEASLATTAIWSVGRYAARHRNVHAHVPSWSWASVTSNVNYAHLKSAAPMEEIQSLCSKLQVSSAGERSSTGLLPVPYVLEVSGFLTKAKLNYTPTSKPNADNNDWWYVVVPGEDSSKTLAMNQVTAYFDTCLLETKPDNNADDVLALYEFCADYLLHEPGPHQVQQGESIYCLKFGIQRSKLFSLVLRRLDAASNIFERIGLLVQYRISNSVADENQYAIDLYKGVRSEIALTII